MKPPSNAKPIPLSASLDLLTWVFIQEMTPEQKKAIEEIIKNKQDK